MSKAELVENNGVDVEFELAGSEFKMNSLDVASVFEKQHKHVIEKIEKIDRFAKLLTGSKIRLSEYQDKSGKSNKSYQFDRDVFSFIVMSFTGKKAEEWKWAYIDAFNKMEQLLKDGSKQIEEITGFMEISKSTNYPKTQLIKAHYRTSKSEEAKEMAKKVRDTMKQIEEIEKLNHGLIDYTDILNKLEDDLMIFLNAKRNIQIRDIKLMESESVAS